MVSLMIHPLDGPRLKVRRAEQDLDLLGKEIEAFRLTNQYQIIPAEFNPQSKQIVYRARVPRYPPLEWGLDIGDIAHNLRSALDGLVHHLVLVNGKTATLQTQFPV